MKEIWLREVRRIKTGNKDIITFEVPPQFQMATWNFFNECSKKKVNFFNVSVSIPYRMRTKGRNSQNHKINGDIQQICMYTGMEFEELKHILKKRAIKRGYPFTTLPDGEVYPWSESRIDVVQASYLIDEIEQYAAENGIELKEWSGPNVNKSNSGSQERIE